MKKEGNPWTLSEQELYARFSTSESGLGKEEAEKRLDKEGYNEVEKGKKRNGLRIFLSQFKNSFVLLLIAAAIISYIVDAKTDSLVIFSIIVINSFLGFIQEYKAERSLLDLEKYIDFKSRVMRDGKIMEIDSREIVAGDIVYLVAGDIVPADIRLISSNDISNNESALTGESLPVIKNTKILNKNNLAFQDLKNMALMGTSITTGHGYGIAVSCGKNSFFGQTAGYLKQENEGEFQKNIREFSNFLLKITLIATFFIFLINALFGKGIATSFLFALALAVGITPEILPVILTLTLSRGAVKMAKQKVVVKELISIENLGNIDTLCCDKTGTLTEGNVSLAGYYDSEGEKDRKILAYGVLCNSAKHGSNDPIDNSILKSIEARSLTRLKDFTLIDTNEFDFERKRMSVLVRENSKNIVIVKGAFESVLKVCKYALIKDRRVFLSKKISEKIEQTILGYEKQGYKVIALAEKQTSKNSITKEDEKELSFSGFLVFLDPPKKDAYEAFVLFKKLGVNLKVLSGDSPTITRKVCNEVGLGITGNRVVTGSELEKLNREEFEKYVREYNVFARISPIQKYNIVSSLNKEGHVVGFLGDGINDAPALKAADVGISVNSAVQVAKDAANIILLKKSLMVVGEGIIEGRKTFGNTTKYILNTMSANYGNMTTVAVSSLFMGFIPLLPSQILLNNLVSDIPNLTMSSDNVDPELLKRPRKWNLGFIHKFMIYFGLLSSIFDFILIGFLLFYFKAEETLFRTAWFVESLISEIIVVFAIRTQRSFFKSRPSNLLIISSVLVGVFSFAIIYTAFGTRFFEFVKIPISILMLIFIILLVYFVSVEIFKKYFFRKYADK